MGGDDNQRLNQIPISGHLSIDSSQFAGPVTGWQRRAFRNTLLPFVGRESDDRVDSALLESRVYQ